MVSKKVILTGSFGVGKTSLFERFINNKFADKYLTTIGVKVGKKMIKTPAGEVSMLIWDIAGEVSQDKVPKSYFLGTSGIIYVFDVSRPSTFVNLASDVEYIREHNNFTHLKIVGNKKDLVSDVELDAIREQIELPIDLFTSAKTGENVEELFVSLAQDLVQ